MLYKEIENKNCKIHIYRKKSLTQNKYEYFLQVFTKGFFGSWVVNENYKQKTEINSEKIAIEIAYELTNH
jgi:hypothetical protein